MAGRETPFWQQLTRKCVHFNGTVNDRCDAGVEYTAVRDTSATPFRFPCFKDEGVSSACPVATFRTEEQARAREAEIREASRHFWAAIERGECPNHPAIAVTFRKVGRCVYAYPCGCRLYQGDVPEQAKVVPS